MSKPVIVVTGADLAPQALELLKKFDVVYAGKTPTEESLIKLCEDKQPVAILVRYGGVSARMMDASRKLKVIAKHGVGIDTIDSQAAAQRGIAVKAAVGANADAVAEHTWALIFDCAKGTSHLNARTHSGHWDKSTHKSLELKGKTLGLIGLGAIGQRTAAVGTALGMRVIGFDPYASSAIPGVTLCELDDVLAQSDVVSLHCPLTPENRNMINRDTLAKMRDGAILVNTARGGLIDEAALLEAIKAGKLRAAGLDSFQKEPMQAPHIFHGVGNIVLTPHVGGVTSDAYVSMGTAAARNILAVMADAEAEAEATE
jgi:D-3-phosphoglycerate dehydrogenase